jgi:hypothetical protein
VNKQAEFEATTDTSVHLPNTSTASVSVSVSLMLFLLVHVSVCLTPVLLVNVLALPLSAPSPKQWVINTPDEGAIKWWIGNAAEDGKAATVFARLKVPASDGEGGTAAVHSCAVLCGVALCYLVPHCVV